MTEGERDSRVREITEPAPAFLRQAWSAIRAEKDKTVLAQALHASADYRRRLIHDRLTFLRSRLVGHKQNRHEPAEVDDG